MKPGEMLFTKFNPFFHQLITCYFVKISKALYTLLTLLKKYFIWYGKLLKVDKFLKTLKYFTKDKKETNVIMACIPYEMRNENVIRY